MEDTFLRFDPDASGTRRSRLSLRFAWAAGTTMLGLYAVLAVEGPRAQWVFGVAAFSWLATTFIEAHVEPAELISRRARALRIAYCVAMVALTDAFGAVARDEVSSLWALSLMAGSVLASASLERHRWFLAVLAAIAPVEVLLVHGASSGLRVGAAVVAGVVTVSSIAIQGRAYARAAEQRRAAELEARELELHRSGVGALAMTIHDGVSGLLLVARTKLATSTNFDDVRPLIARILVSIERVVARPRPRTVSELERELSEVARVVGTTLRVQTEGDLEILDEGERDDLFDIACEAALNAMRDASPSIDVTLAALRGRAVVRVRSSRNTLTKPSTGGGGRGLRYALLRTTLRHGRAAFEADAQGVELVASWPRRRVVVVVDTISALAPVAAIAILIGVASSNTRSLGPALAFPTLGATVALIERRTRTPERVRAVLAEADNPARSAARDRARAILAPHVASLSRATEDADLDAARPALADLSRAVSELLRELEAPEG